MARIASSRRSRTHAPNPGSTSEAKPLVTRLLVADAQAIDRGGLVGLLDAQRDFDVVGEAAGVKECVEQCRALEPDVLILSLNLPGQDRAAVIPTIRRELPQLRIFAIADRGADDCLVLNPPSRQLLPLTLKLSCPEGIDCLQLAVNQGAMGTIRRNADPEDLFRGIRAVARGQAWYDPTTASGLLTTSARDGNSPGAKRAQFSERELEVAALISEGQSNKEISTALGISEPTVKKHVGHILQKLALSDRLQAGLYLARNPTIFKR